MPKDYSPHQISYALSLTQLTSHLSAQHQIKDREGLEQENLNAMLELLDLNNCLTDYSIKVENLYHILSQYNPLLKKTISDNFNILFAAAGFWPVDFATFQTLIQDKNFNKGITFVYFCQVGTPEQLKELGTVLSESTVKSIHFAKGSIDDNGFNAFVEGIKQNLNLKSSLVSLDIADNKLTVESTSALTYFLEQTNIEYFNLSNNLIGNSSFHLTGSLYANHHSRLSHLYLAGCGLTPNTIGNWQHIFRFDKKFKAIDFRRNNLERLDEVAFSITSSPSKLNYVAVSAESINQSSIDRLIDLIDKQETLRTLILSGCHLTEQQISALQEANNERMESCEIKVEELEEINQRVIDTTEEESEEEQTPTYDLQSEGYADFTMPTADIAFAAESRGYFESDSESNQITSQNLIYCIENNDPDFSDYLFKAIFQHENPELQRALIKELIPYCKKSANPDSFRGILLDAYIKIRSEDNRTYFGFLKFLNSFSLFKNSFNHYSREEKIKAAEQSKNGKVESKYLKTANQGLLGEIISINKPTLR